MEKFLVLAAAKTLSSTSSPKKSPTSFIEFNDWIFFCPDIPQHNFTHWAILSDFIPFFPSAKEVD